MPKSKTTASNSKNAGTLILSLVLAWPGYEEALKEELNFYDHEFEEITEQAFLITSESALPLFAFARQTLNGVTLMKSSSIKATAEAIASLIPEAGMWALHFFSALEKSEREIEKSGRASETGRRSTKRNSKEKKSFRT